MEREIIKKYQFKDGLKLEFEILDISKILRGKREEKGLLLRQLIVLERALDTTKKLNLKHAMGDKFNAF